MLLVLVYARRHGLFPTTWDILDGRWTRYFTIFWATHLFLGTFLILSFAVIFVFHLLRDPFYRFIPPQPPHPADEQMLSLVRRGSIALAFAFFALASVSFPVLHLLVPSWLQLIPLALNLLAVYLTYQSFVFPQKSSSIDEAVLNLRFKGTPLFDVASMASQPVDSLV